MSETVGRIGRCHVCEKQETIDYCAVCKHWFCVTCKKNIPRRAWEAVMELLKGPTPGCCGPS